MKFKMAPNSLFAILLRSPWWISLGLAAIFGLASRALLPEAYWVFGAMGGAPFIVIGLIALKRQITAPSAKRVEAVLGALNTMAWRDFALTLEKAYARDGYGVTRLEGAADLVLTKDGRTTFVAAKRWKAARHGEDALLALHAAMKKQDGSACIYIALGELSGNAQRVARDHGIAILQGDGLVPLLRDWQP